jgi:hypothetical protein
MSASSFVNRLNEFEKETYRIGMSIQQKVSDEAIADARVSTFYNLAQLIRSCKIYYILKEEYLQDRQWYVDTYLQKWQQHWPVSAVAGGKAAVIHNKHKILNNDFDQIMLIGYTQILFSIMKSGFRLLLIAIDPTASKKYGADDFYLIYGWLLDRTKRKNCSKFINM